MFFDSVHFLKNIRNNLLNAKRFLFPLFSFSEFYDDISVPGGELSWKLLHDVYDNDQSLQGNLRKASKLSYRALHPGDNKQSVPLALAIFDPASSAAILSYYPERQDAAEFLKSINLWWTISNSKQQFNKNYAIGNAACKNNLKPQFLRTLANWLNQWKTQQRLNAEKFTLSKQTCDALVITLRCTAALIEDLLGEGYEYVLTARFQTDPLELRFSKYLQMSGGRFLVRLREVEISKRILATKSLLKESIIFWNEDVHPNNMESSEMENFKAKLNELSSDFECCTLDHGAKQVAAVVAGYAAKKIIKRSQCEQTLTAINPQNSFKEFEYLSKLNRGGFTLPSVDLAQYVSKSFAILESAFVIILNSSMNERDAGKCVLTKNTCSQSFLCEQHTFKVKFINRIICNVYFNDAQKLSANEVRKDTV